MAESALHFSAAAYCSQYSLQNWQCGTPCSFFSSSPTNLAYLFDPNLNVAGYVAKFPAGNTIVSFRGTIQQIQDWIDDLDFFKVTYPLCDSCETHDGFTSSFNALSTQMYNALESFGSSSSGSLTVTGHSLGGAIATLAALDLVHNGYTVEHLYTFGAPRVGNPQFATFAEYVSNSTLMDVYRVVHYADVVPHLPPESFGFTHTPREIFYSEDSSYYRTCNAINGEDGNCSDSISDFDLSVSDHLDYMNYAISGSCQ